MSVEYLRSTVAGSYLYARAAEYDAAGHRIAGSTSIAEEYIQKPYTENELCMHLGQLYRCSLSGGITVAEEWNSEHWEPTCISDQIGNVEALLAAL